MNDYVIGRFARERQAAYVREVEHDELVAQIRRARSEQEAVGPLMDRARPWAGVRDRWQDLLRHIAPPHRPAHGHR